MCEAPGAARETGDAIHKRRRRGGDGKTSKDSRGLRSFLDNDERAG
jgi:hypothetical protein